MAPADTRGRILEAALSCFLTEGYERTTVTRIRERSGVSNGALFHHFKTKEAIADALYVGAMKSFQEGLWELLRREPRSLHAAVEGAITHQLGWIEANPDRARFVYMRGVLDWSSPGGEQMAALNRDLGLALARWLEPLIDAGELRVTSILMFTAIVTGPGHAIAQRWLAGQIDARPTEFASELAAAAHAAISGMPAGQRRPAGTALPRRGRVELELIGGDGSVLATASSTAELVPSGQGAVTGG